MKTPTSKTTEVSAPDKANSTRITFGLQPPHDLSHAEQEFLFILGEVAGSCIAAHLHQRQFASMNTSHQVTP